MKRICKDCIYYAQTSVMKDGGCVTVQPHGECRRNPPVVTLLENWDTRTNWPGVEDGDWCGEFKGATSS